MKKVLVIAMLFCGMAQMAQIVEIGDKVENTYPIRPAPIPPRPPITKENVIMEIKEACKYGGYTICSFSPTTIQKNWLWGEKEVAFYHSDSYVVSFIEMERILEKLSTFKIPQNTKLSAYQNMIKTTVQDIYKDIQKLHKDDPELFELVENYKKLHKKYANMQITQAMINALKAPAQQQWRTISKLRTQQLNQDLEKMGKIDIKQPILRILPPSDNGQELKKLERDTKRDTSGELESIRKESQESHNKIPEPQGTSELDAQISSKEIELSLLVQEIRFLEMQREIQKVEKMSQAQLTQYVIQHSVCNKKQLKEEEECNKKRVLDSSYDDECEICSDTEMVIDDAKKGRYNPGYMFNPTTTESYTRPPGNYTWQDEEGNYWSSTYHGYHIGGIIIERAYRLNDIAQALKDNDMPKLYQSLRSFEEFAKNKEKDFISQLIKHIKHSYKIDDVYRD